MMLFFDGDPESKDASGIGGATAIYAAQGALEQLSESWEALGTFVIPKTVDKMSAFVDLIGYGQISNVYLSKPIVSME